MLCSFAHMIQVVVFIPPTSYCPTRNMTPAKYPGVLSINSFPVLPNAFQIVSYPLLLVFMCPCHLPQNNSSDRVDLLLFMLPPRLWKCGPGLPSSPIVIGLTRLAVIDLLSSPPPSCQSGVPTLTLSSAGTTTLSPWFHHWFSKPLSTVIIAADKAPKSLARPDSSCRGRMVVPTGGKEEARPEREERLSS